MEGVTTLRDKVQKALLEWKAEVSTRQTLLQSAMSVSIYNGIVEDIRVKTYDMATIFFHDLGK